MTLLLAAAVGLMAGVHTATWGMYKDAPHEGFSRWKYARSIVLGTVIGVIVSAVLGARSPARGGPGGALRRDLRGGAGAGRDLQDLPPRRGPVEVLHPDAVRGLRQGGPEPRRPAARRRGLRRGAAGAWCAGRCDRPGDAGSDAALAGRRWSAGSAAGSARSAARGRTRPSEGFQIFKFFRSPIIASLFALGLSYLSDDLVLVTLAATGFCVATTETYKTFFFPSVPRGKFAGMPVHFPDMLRRRQPFIFLYAAIWLVVLVALFVALKGVPSPGVTSMWRTGQSSEVSTEGTQDEHSVSSVPRASGSKMRHTFSKLDLYEAAIARARADRRLLGSHRPPAAGAARRGGRARPGAAGVPAGRRNAGRRWRSWSIW